MATDDPKFKYGSYEIGLKEYLQNLQNNFTGYLDSQYDWDYSRKKDFTTQFNNLYNALNSEYKSNNVQISSGPTGDLSIPSSYDFANGDGMKYVTSKGQAVSQEEYDQLKRRDQHFTQMYNANNDVAKYFNLIANAQLQEERKLQKEADETKETEEKNRVDKLKYSLHKDDYDIQKLFEDQVNPYDQPSLFHSLMTGYETLSDGKYSTSYRRSLLADFIKNTYLPLIEDVDFSDSKYINSSSYKVKLNSAETALKNSTISDSKIFSQLLSLGFDAQFLTNYLAVKPEDILETYIDTNGRPQTRSYSSNPQQAGVTPGGSFTSESDPVLELMNEIKAKFLQKVPEDYKIDDSPAIIKGLFQDLLSLNNLSSQFLPLWDESTNSVSNKYAVFKSFDAEKGIMPIYDKSNYSLSYMTFNDLVSQNCLTEDLKDKIYKQIQQLAKDRFALNNQAAHKDYFFRESNRHGGRLITFAAEGASDTEFVAPENMASAGPDDDDNTTLEQAINRMNRDKEIENGGEEAFQNASVPGSRILDPRYDYSPNNEIQSILDIFEPQDYCRMAAIVSDIAALVDPEPISSGILNLISVGTNIAADKMEGYSPLTIAGNAALGLFFSVASEIPYIGSIPGNGAKIVRSISHLIPKFGKAFGKLHTLTLVGLTGISTMNIKAAIDSISKLNKPGDKNLMTVQDWANIAYGVQSLLTLKGVGRQAVQKITRGASKNKTTIVDQHTAQSEGMSTHNQGTQEPKMQHTHNILGEDGKITPVLDNSHLGEFNPDNSFVVSTKLSSNSKKKVNLLFNKDDLPQLDNINQHMGVNGVTNYIKQAYPSLSGAKFNFETVSIRGRSGLPGIIKERQNVVVFRRPYEVFTKDFLENPRRYLADNLNLQSSGFWRNQINKVLPYLNRLRLNSLPSYTRNILYNRGLNQVKVSPELKTDDFNFDILRNDILKNNVTKKLNKLVKVQAPGVAGPEFSFDLLYPILYDIGVSKRLTTEDEIRNKAREEYINRYTPETSYQLGGTIDERVFGLLRNGGEIPFIKKGTKMIRYLADAGETPDEDGGDISSASTDTKSQTSVTQPEKYYGEGFSYDPNNTLWVNGSYNGKNLDFSGLLDYANQRRGNSLPWYLDNNSFNFNDIQDVHKTFRQINYGDNLDNNAIRYSDFNSWFDKWIESNSDATLGKMLSDYNNDISKLYTYDQNVAQYLSENQGDISGLVNTPAEAANLINQINTKDFNETHGQVYSSYKDKNKIGWNPDLLHIWGSGTASRPIDITENDVEFDINQLSEAAKKFLIDNNVTSFGKNPNGFMYVIQSNTEDDETEDMNKTDEVSGQATWSGLSPASGQDILQQMHFNSQKKSEDPWPDYIQALRKNLALWTNKKQDVDLPVNLEIPSEAQRFVEGDFKSLADAENSASEFLRRANHSGTSDAMTNAAMLFSAQSSAEDALSKGREADNKAVAASSEEVRKQNDLNRQSRYTTSSTNRNRIFKNVIDKIARKQALRAANTKAKDDYLSALETDIRNKDMKKEEVSEALLSRSIRNYVLSNLQATIGCSPKDEALYNAIQYGSIKVSDLAKEVAPENWNPDKFGSFEDANQRYAAMQRAITDAIYAGISAYYGVSFNRQGLQHGEFSVSDVEAKKPSEGASTPSSRTGGVISSNKSEASVQIQKLRNKAKHMELLVKQLGMKMTDFQKSLDRAQKSSSDYIKGQTNKK